MSEHVTVEAVKDARDWTSDDGKIKLTFYTLDVKRESGFSQEVDHSRKQGGKEPKPGEELDVIFEEGKYRPKMKKAPQGSFAGGSTERSTGGSKGNWQPESERDPERAAHILRQHSQEMALRFMQLTGQSVGSVSEVFQVADKFDQDVIQAGQAVNSTQGNAARNEAGASPSQSASPGSSSSPAEERTDVEMALSEPPGGKFLAAKARELITSYMLSQLQPDDLQRACNQLTNSADQGQQEQTLRAMKQRTERWKGEPLPADTDADEVPF